MRIYLNFVVLMLALGGNLQAQPTPLPSPETNQAPPAQTPSQAATEEEIASGDVLRISANLVSVPVTVLNRQGQFIVDLQQKDFRIFEDGEEQTIAHFSNVDRPFSVALLIDTSGSTAPFLDQIKRAAKAFVEQLRPSDFVRPAYFHGEIRLLTKTNSNDPRGLSAAIDQMEAGPIMLGTRLYDAVDFGLNVLQADSARKAMIVFTDGENTWGKSTMKGTLEEAEESGVIIYTIQYGDMPANKYLQRLASKTGGRYFKAGDSNLIQQSFAGVAEELRRQYWIGYYPKQSANNRSEKRIKVKVNRERLAVRARSSYTARP